MRSLLTLVVTLAVPCLASAAPPAEKTLAELTELPVEVSGDVAKVSKPRSDIAEVVDGRPLKPFQGLTSWAAFQASGDEVLVMGDLVLLAHEVNPALSAALASGLEVTALHNHFFYDEPRVYFMHVGGHGSLESLARAVKATLDAAAAAPKADGFGGTAAGSADAIEAAPLEQILGTAAQVKDGMVKFVFGRTAKMHDAAIGAAASTVAVRFAGMAFEDEDVRPRAAGTGRLLISRGRGVPPRRAGP